MVTLQPHSMHSSHAMVLPSACPTMCNRGLISRRPLSLKPALPQTRVQPRVYKQWQGRVSTGQDGGLTRPIGAHLALLQLWVHDLEGAVGRQSQQADDASPQGCCRFLLDADQGRDLHAAPDLSTRLVLLACTSQGSSWLVWILNLHSRTTPGA